ncbi:hypothetical protein WR25_26061 isoform C [Diploscapter pachys]|uniref:C3H1-type domain-containing protein n=1 Tax=Diploscapter pachys TaxID=2018661 RepID=A0A2A2K758_9BILA|nr:hypothetical protein WR25_26061 isoform B [Diploscapter pachys]PAV69817.1 hypothetical protein WR25_26061 isoform C [Diploscapter pachys]
MMICSCDAEPAALAKYVLALLKKPDKTDEELKDFSLGQLEVFLQAGTKKFVDKMFQAIKDKSYIPEPAPLEIEEPKSQVKPEPESPTKKPAEPRRQAASQRGRDKENDTKASSSRDVKDMKPTADSAEISTRRRGGVTQPVSSTSQANSAAKEERTERIDRPGRNDRADRVERAPLRRGAEERRTGTGTGIGGDNVDAASADRPERTIRKRISPPPGAEPKKDVPVRGSNYSMGRRRSRSPRAERRGPGVRAAGGRSRPSPERAHRRRSRSRSRSPRSRSPREERRRRRCKNYDEQGFCLRGDQCPYDHGPDPVVVDDSALGNIVKLPGVKGLPANFSVPPPGYNPMNPPPPGVEQPPNAYAASSQAGGIGEGYNPETPGLNASGNPNYSVPPPPLPVHMNAGPWRGAGYSVPTTANAVVGYDPSGGIPIDPSSAPPHSSAQGQTGTIPTHYGRGQQQNPMGGGGGGGPIRGRGRGRGRGGYMTRGGAHSVGGQGGANGNAASDGRTLQVKKIPPDQNNIAKLNEHFAQFGNIVNMQIRFGDPETALITYATRHEATAAYKSPTPVFNNRFIKVFFYQQPESVPVPGEQSKAGGSSSQAADAQGTTPVPGVAQQPAEKQKVATVKESKFVNPAVKEKRQKAVIAKTQLKKEKPAYGLLLELQKRNVALLQKLIESQKTVVAKVRAAKDEKAKSAALKLVKDIQDRIKTCKAEVDKSTAELKEKKALIEELQTAIVEAKPGGTTVKSESGVEGEDGDGEKTSIAGKGSLKRAAGDSSDEDDLLEPKRKPGKLIVRGFDAKDEQELIEHLEKFGDLRDFDIIPGSKPTASVVTFKRYEAAERALIEGRTFTSSAGNKRNAIILNMDWYSPEAAAEGNAVVPDKERAADQQLNANQLLASIPKSEESDEEVL